MPTERAAADRGAEHDTERRERASAVRHGLVAALVVLVVSVAAGALTPFGQQYLPPWLSSLCNSSGGWTAVTFFAVYLSRARLPLAVILGIASFILMNETYGRVSELRGYASPGGMSSMWNYIAVIVGPIVGIAAAWLRSPQPWLVAVGAAAPAAVFIGEGYYGLTAIAETTSPVYWWLQIAAGVTIVAVVSLRRLRAPGPIALACALAVVGAVVFDSAYTGVPSLVG
jgi:hypothetical protein